MLARLEPRRRRSSRGVWFGIGLLMIWLAATGILALAVLGGAGLAVAYPAQAGIVLSACSRLLSSALWPIRGAGIVLTGAGLSPQAGAAAYLGITGALFCVCAWLVTRRPFGPRYA